MFGIFGIKISELVRIELVHDVFAKHICQFVRLHLAMQGDSAHQLDILFRNAVCVEHREESLNHNLPHIGFFGCRKRLTVVIK